MAPLSDGDAGADQFSVCLCASACEVVLPECGNMDPSAAKATFR
jgi:hypothetical protein